MWGVAHADAKFFNTKCDRSDEDTQAVPVMFQVGLAKNRCKIFKDEMSYLALEVDETKCYKFGLTVFKFKKCNFMNFFPLKVF